MIHSFRRSIAAAWLAVSVAVALAPSVAHAQLSNEAQAQLRFSRGRDLFVQHNYEGALTEFRAAVSLVGSPNTRLYIARCLHELHRNAEAYIEYQRAAAEASDRATNEPRYAATRDTARSESAALQPLLGNLLVRVPNAPDGTEVTVDGAQIPSAGWGIATPFDPHAVEVRGHAPGHLPFSQRITIQQGQTAEVTVEMRPEPTHPTTAATTAAATTVRTERVREGGGIRLAGIAVAIVGVLAGGAGGVFYALAANDNSQLAHDCPNGCPNPNDPRISQGETYQTLSWILAPVGAALVIAGVVMIAVGGPHEVLRTVGPSARRPQRRIASWTFFGAPTVTGSGGVVGLGGTF